MMGGARIRLFFVLAASNSLLALFIVLFWLLFRIIERIVVNFVESI